MQQFILPVRIILNPPDVILTDLFYKNSSLIEQSYLIELIGAFEMPSIRFLGTYQEENGPTKLLKTEQYLLWNRSNYTAQIFCEEEKMSDMLLKVESFKEENIIFLLSQLNFYVQTYSSFQILDLNISGTKEPIQIQNYSIISNHIVRMEIEMDATPLLFRYKIPDPKQVEGLFINDLINTKGTNRIVTYPVNATNITNNIFESLFEYKYSPLAKDISSFVSDFYMLIDYQNHVTETIYKFVTIILTSESADIVNIDNNIFDKQFNLLIIRR